MAHDCFASVKHNEGHIFCTVCDIELDLTAYYTRKARLEIGSKQSSTMSVTKSKTGQSVKYIKHVIHYQPNHIHSTQKCICESRNIVVVAEHDEIGFNGYYCLMCDSYWCN